MDAGILRLRPGDSTTNHFHHRLDEIFLVLEGTASMWIDATHRVPLLVGESYLSRAGEMHYFINESNKVFRAFFVKSPFDPADTNPVPWAPGNSVPNHRGDPEYSPPAARSSAATERASDAGPSDRA